MFRLDDPLRPAPALPAFWLIATAQRPATQPERSALRRGLARRIAATQLGIAEEAVGIAHDARGRPLLVAPARGLQISLATRAGVVAVALAERPVGVDVEAAAAAPVPLSVLHPAERRHLEGLAEPERPLAFARLWAAKEAYVKALGLGFACPPESFAAHDLGPRFIVEDPRRGRTEGELHQTRNGGQVALAAAVIVLG